MELIWLLAVTLSTTKCVWSQDGPQPLRRTSSSPRPSFFNNSGNLNRGGKFTPDSIQFAGKQQSNAIRHKPTFFLNDSGARDRRAVQAENIYVGIPVPTVESRETIQMHQETLGRMSVEDASKELVSMLGVDTHSSSQSFAVVEHLQILPDLRFFWNPLGAKAVVQQEAFEALVRRGLAGQSKLKSEEIMPMEYYAGLHENYPAMARKQSDPNLSGEGKENVPLRIDEMSKAILAAASNGSKNKQKVHLNVVYGTPNPNMFYLNTFSTSGGIAGVVNTNNFIFKAPDVINGIDTGVDYGFMVKENIRKASVTALKGEQAKALHNIIASYVKKYMNTEDASGGALQYDSNVAIEVRHNLSCLTMAKGSSTKRAQPATGGYVLGHKLTFRRLRVVSVAVRGADNEITTHSRFVKPLVTSWHIVDFSKESRLDDDEYMTRFTSPLDDHDIPVKRQRNAKRPSGEDEAMTFGCSTAKLTDAIKKYKMPITSRMYYPEEMYYMSCLNMSPERTEVTLQNGARCVCGDGEWAANGRGGLCVKN